MEGTLCPISGDPATMVSIDGQLIEIDCRRCGRFRLSLSAIGKIGTKSREEREALLSSARRDAQGGEGIPVIRDA